MYSNNKILPISSDVATSYSVEFEENMQKEYPDYKGRNQHSVAKHMNMTVERLFEN